MTDVSKNSNQTNSDPDAMHARLIELERALRERDARLQRLTSQSLDLLDELTATRLKAADRGRLQERVEDLTQRVRHAGRVVVGRAPLQPSEVEIVVWALPGEGQNETTIGEAVRKASKVAGEVPVRGLWGEDSNPVAFASAAGPRNELQIADHPTPGIAWNNAMAASTAPVVVFLEASTTLLALDRGGLAALVDRAIASGAIRIETDRTKAKDRATSIGLTVSKRFRTKPATYDSEPLGKKAVRDASQPTGPELQVIEAVDPRAFALRRDAWIDVGPFDGDLHGLTALLDWTERANARGMRHVALPATRTSAPAWEELREITDTDRLVVLSRYRPTEVGGALGRADVLWELSRAGLRDRLRAIWSHLPTSETGDIGVDTLIEQSVQVIESTLPADRMLTMLGRLSKSFGGMLEEEIAVDDDVDPRTVAEQRLEHLGQLMTHLQDVGQAAREEKHAARREVDGIMAMLGARESELGHLKNHVGALEEDIAGRVTHMVAVEDHRLELVAKIEGLEARVDEVGVKLGETLLDNERLDARCHSLQRDVERQEARLQVEQAANKGLVEQLAALIQEVGKRRVFPRSLTPEERSILRDRGIEP